MKAVAAGPDRRLSTSERTVLREKIKEVTGSYEAAGDWEENEG